MRMVITVETSSGQRPFKLEQGIDSGKAIMFSVKKSTSVLNRISYCRYKKRQRYANPFF